MKKILPAILLVLLLSGCTEKGQLDQESYKLGSVAAFSEMINAGVKKMALSSTMTSEEMDDFMPLAKEAASKYNVSIYRENDLITTALFPETIAKNLEVLVLFQGSTKDEYLQLKEKKNRLIQQNKYGQDESLAVARHFGRMLSYSPKKINKLLAGNSDFRTMADFGIKANNPFLYYQNLSAATKFYEEILGLEKVAEYDNASIMRMSADSYLILVDAAKGMHSTQEAKSVALALLTDDLQAWYDHFKKNNVKIKYTLKEKEGSAHDGFVAIDPEGYLLEIERFNPHPENENFTPRLDKNKTLEMPSSPLSKVPKGLHFYSTVTWLYHKDVMGMEHFYQDVLGLEMVCDQGWAKIYQVSETGFMGIVDEKRGMNKYSEEKAVNIGFILEDLKGWHEYNLKHKPLELRNEELGEGPEGKYKAFVGYGPEKYFYEFDAFFPHDDNDLLLEYLEK